MMWVGIDKTPLHLLSARLAYMEQNVKGLFPTMPTEDTVRIAEILINNGAHMDAVDDFGNEASGYFPQRFPQWSFNVSFEVPGS